MHIQCTKSDARLHQTNLAEHDTDNDMYAWHAHLIKRKEKKFISFNA